MSQQNSEVLFDENMNSNDDDTSSSRDGAAGYVTKQQQQCKEVIHKNEENGKEATNEMLQQQRKEDGRNDNKVEPDKVKNVEDTVDKLNESKNVENTENASKNVTDKQREEIETLTRQIEVLRKRKQLLELQNELAKCEINENKCTNNRVVTRDVSFDTLREFLPVFDGDNNFEIWLCLLENVRNNYVVGDDMLRALICNKLKGRAQEWLYTNPVHMSETLDDFLQEMKNMFGMKESKLNVRYKMQNRVWQKGERFDTYYNEKLLLANSLKIDEDEFIEYIIEGIPDVNLRNTAKLRCFTTKNEILQAFRNVELITNTTLQQSSGRSSATNNFAAKSGKVTEQPPKRDIKCYNCNSKGHIASDCRKPKREDGACFACAGFGHQAKDCELYRKTERKNEQNDYNVS
ncbi:uncharacterized protein LOC135958534 [Calliphora vicina]|uniref:uncharacterized protein LOC135958534 n=1 Tax=Calliphora vicina TaxID=7373 RepID=UPI00325B5777